MIDRDDSTWMAELSGLRGRQRQEEAFQDLGYILLPLIRWYLSNHASHGPDMASYYDLEQLAQDIVQESLEHIWGGLSSYRGEARFLTFAKAIALNQARQVLRWRRRRPEEPLPSSSNDEMEEEREERFPLTTRSQMAMAELCPEQQATFREVVQCVDHILTEECSPREREAFVSKHLDGLSSREIAQMMNTTERAVNLLTFNARQKLRRGLEEKEYTLSAILAILNK